MPLERAVHEMKKEELIALIKEVRRMKDDAPVKKRNISSKSQ